MSAQTRFEPYPETKDSGIEWLGEIPAHWEARRLKLIATINDEALGEDTDSEYEIAYVDIGNVDATRGILEKESYLFSDAPSRARRIVRDGDVIVSTVRTYLRAIAPISDPEPNLVVSTGFAVIRPRSGLGTGYASYMLRAPYFVDRVVAESVGVSYPAINAWQLGTFGVAVPDKDEQQAIAEFLDRETAVIDALDEKKERLIELLQEKRTALITNAVTKGLDPDAPMKDSGIEWLGQIPAHWDVVRLKHASGGLTVGVVVNPSTYVCDSGVPFLRGVDIAEGRILRDSVQFMSEESNRVLSKSTLRSGDLVSIRVGYPGVTAVVPEELDGSNCASLMITRRSDRASSGFLCLVMNSAVGKAQFAMLQNGAAQEQINVSDAVDFLVPMPPVPEQQAVATFLDRETAKIDALIAKVGEAIERLKEYRTALISAAVTGKIDVRGEAEPDHA